MNYESIIENLTESHVKQILNKLEIPFDDCGDYLVMPTYCHNHKDEEASKKLYYYKNSKIFMCYTSCEAQSIFKFLRNFYQAQNYEYDWYNDIYRLITDTTNFNAIDGFSTPAYKSIRDKFTKRKEIVLEEYQEGVLDCFSKYYPIEWLRDNISKEAMDKFNIRFSTAHNKIIIPHYDINNRLIGIRGRALNPDEAEIYGKYMPIMVEGKWYSHSLSLNLYGLNINKENIKRTGVCYIVESEKAVLQAESFNIPNCCVAICGSHLNKYALNILIKECHPKEIILCLDNEELPKEDKYFHKLYKICEKYSNYCSFSFVYDRDGITKLKDSPTDHGEEIFKKLIEKRIKVMER